MLTLRPCVRVYIMYIIHLLTHSHVAVHTYALDARLVHACELTASEYTLIGRRQSLLPQLAMCAACVCARAPVTHMVHVSLSRGETCRVQSSATLTYEVSYQFITSTTRTHTQYHYSLLYMCTYVYCTVYTYCTVSV